MRGGERGRGFDRIGGGGGPILASPPSPNHIKEMQLEQQRVLLRQQQQFQSRFPMSRQKSMIDLREPYLEQQQQQQYHHAYHHPHPSSQHFSRFPQETQQHPQGKHKPGPLLRSRTEHDLKRSRSRGSGLDMIHRQAPQPTDHVPTVLRRQMVRESTGANFS